MTWYASKISGPCGPLPVSSDRDRPRVVKNRGVVATTIMIENDPPEEMSEAELAHELRTLSEGKDRSDRFESLLSEVYDRLDELAERKEQS